MKYMTIFMFCGLVFAQEHQSVSVPAVGLSNIEFGFTGSVADVNNGLVPYSAPDNQGATYFSIAAISGGTLLNPVPFYNIVNYGVTSSPPISTAYIDIVVPPTKGTLRTVGGSFFQFTPNGQLGDDIAVIRFLDGLPNANPLEIGSRRTLAIKIVNSPPTNATINASPTFGLPGTVFALTASAADPNGHTLSYSYDYGDGSSGSDPSHSYAAAGVYTVTVTASDGFGGTVQASTQITVYGTDHVPTARFATSDIVGFESIPLGFDAFYSTDPQNAIVSYLWDFGDGSLQGTGQAISKVYTTLGTYTVTLTIQDAEGLSSSTQRQIEVLPADQIGVFNAFIEFKTAFDRNKTAKDSITLKARLNVGDSQIGDGSAVALDIAGQRFTATLDKRLRATVKVAPKQTWKVQFGTRRQSAGQVDVQVTIKNANLGLGFAQLGAVPGGDGSASVSVPVRLEVGAFSVEIPCDTEFDFNSAGTKAKGEGASE